MAEWAKHDRYLGGTGQVELCPQCGAAKFTGSPCRGCQPHEHRAHGPEGCAWCQLLTPPPASERGYVTYQNVKPDPAERRLPRIIPLEDPEIWITTEPAGQDGPWGWLMSRIERMRVRFRQVR